MLSFQNSENPSRGISVTDANGSREEILRISCNIRPTSGLYLNVDVMNAEKVAANLDDVEEAMTQFVAEALTRAAGMGLPVPNIGGGTGA